MGVQSSVETGILSLTLQKFLTEHRNIERTNTPDLIARQRNYEGKVLILDEASMTSTPRWKTC